MDAEKQDVEFVENIVKGLVENPSDVKVARKIDEMGVLITLEVNTEDMGKIIGKEGRTAKALRTLLRVYGAKQNARINMKILEPEGSERPAPVTRATEEETSATEEETTPLEEKATEIV